MIYLSFSDIQKCWCAGQISIMQHSGVQVISPCPVLPASRNQTIFPYIKGLHVISQHLVVCHFVTSTGLHVISQYLVVCPTFHHIQWSARHFTISSCLPVVSPHPVVYLSFHHIQWSACHFTTFGGFACHFKSSGLPVISLHPVVYLSFHNIRWFCLSFYHI